jgi:hypothetical protein
MESSKKPWRPLLEDDKNFDQAVPYDIKKIEEKLIIASQDLEHLDPYYTLSPIYDFTKFFDKISSALSMGFSDITKKVNQMRGKFRLYKDAENIQQLLGKEIALDIHRLNGQDNAKMGHKDDEYKNYHSACRIFLRLLWFMEYLITVFKKILNSNENSVKKILGSSYDEILSPRHTWLVRKAVEAAMFFSVSGTKDDIVKICFNVDANSKEGKDYILKITGLLEKIWKAGVDFYKQCNMLDIK